MSSHHHASIESLEDRRLLAAEGAPVVTVTAPYKGASENGPAIRAFYVVRTGDLSAPLRVNLSVGGSASNGADYGIVGSAVTIAAGRDRVRIAIRPVDDALVEKRERVNLEVVAGDGYTVGAQFSDYLTITDNDGADRRTTITWSTVAPSPIWRCESMKGVIDGKLYVFGGFIGMEGPVHRSDVYDPATNTWTRIADLPQRVTHAASAVDGTRVYLAGGYVGTGPVLGQQDYGTTDVWIYDAATNTYAAGPSLPQPRGAGTMVKIDRTLHFMGGCDRARVDHTDHWTLNLDEPTEGWKESVPLPAARNHFAAVVVEGHIFAIGGQVGPDDNTGAQDSFFVWHPAWSQWRTLPSLAEARSHHNEASFLHGGRIIMLGGIPMGGGSMSSVIAYDPKTGQWSDLTPLPQKRYTGVAAVIDDVIYYSTGATTTTYRGVLS